MIYCINPYELTQEEIENLRCQIGILTGCYGTKNQGYWHTTYGIWQGNVNNILCASHAKFLFRNSLSA